MPPIATHTLGAELERDRLERRVRRMTVAIGVLRQRASQNRREPGAPQRHLTQAISDFEAQIEAMDTRLRDLGTDGPSIQIQRGANGHRYWQHYPTRPLDDR
jgi:GAF domain-containing protein